MTLPRKNIFQTADNFLLQVALQYSLEALEGIDEEQDPEVYAITEAAIAEQTDLINADKFYEC
ncbi:hypothetical protein [Synechococcus phage S-H34]|uniref:Uncharacterized protein n=1 Tax=Synechococcus phage S-H34 TaxID=2718942 RepID=A0A6G8R6F3_9CAUD|nr:hypothetical protein PQC15_gp095 [Synechococcus phage S-H34]QIN96966.1 hypothetical protein [Synechococcus phage S-H34]